MARAQNPNLEILELAVERLGALAEQMMFLGGCATGLLITDPAAPPIRVTRDVDTIVQVASLASIAAYPIDCVMLDSRRTPAMVLRFVDGLQMQ